MNFDNSSSKTKKRRLAPLVASFSSSELLFASGLSLRQDGGEKEAKAVLQLSENEPNFSIVPYTPEKVLALILDCGLSKDSYQQIRLGAIEAGCKLYPPYNAIRDAKEQCMPNNRHSISITNYSASVDLQNLFDHTAACLVSLQKDWLLQKPNIKNFTLHYKIGFNGSTGQSIYKQSSNENNSRNLQQEESLFLTCIVPLELIGFDGSQKNVVWLNPSSTMYCQPVQFSFKKETVEVIKEEERYSILDIYDFNPNYVI